MTALVRDPKPLLKVRQGVLFDDMCMYELLEVLESRAWECRVLANRKELVRAKTESYNSQDEHSQKLWYINPSAVHNLEGLRGLRFYILSLLTVTGAAILHCQEQGYYRQLLDPAWKPRRGPPKRGQQPSVQLIPAATPWDDPEIVALAAPPPRKRRRRAARLPDDDADSNSSGKEVLGSCGSSDGEGHVPTEPAASPLPSGSASSISTSTSTSSSSSESEGSSSSTSSADLALEVPSPPRPRARAQRHMCGRMPFGSASWLTPRYKLGALSGYQITCKLRGHVRCTRERSFINGGGSEDSCLRLLKTWVVWGLACDSADQHKVLMPIVEADMVAGLLLANADLDAAYAGVMVAEPSAGFTVDAPRFSGR